MICSKKNGLPVTVVSLLLLLLFPFSLSVVRASLSRQDKVLPVPENSLRSTQPATGLSKGQFLIASRYLGDPNFSETVVLLVEYNEKGAVGLVINRPTDMKPSDVLSGIRGLEEREETVFIGGPVARNRVVVILQTDSRPEDSFHVFSNMFVSSNRDVLQRLIDEKGAEKRFRLYVGHAGWTTGQLEGEVLRGDWHIVRADPKSVFTKKPAELWQKLFYRSSGEWVKGDNLLP